MDKVLTVYGAPGSGSVPIEAALRLAGRPYRTLDRAPLGQETIDEAAYQVNPMRQVPALVLEDGALMTESAAILIWLAEQHPKARLAPPPGDPARAEFLRWMNFISAAIYGLYWVRDDPSRLVEGEAAQALAKMRTADRIADCWAIMDAQMRPGTFLQGESLGVLDLYVAVLSRWGPRRRRFYEVAPRMSPVVRRVDADPRLAAFSAARFPFAAGWEG